MSLSSKPEVLLTGIFMQKATLINDSKEHRRYCLSGGGVMSATLGSCSNSWIRHDHYPGRAALDTLPNREHTGMAGTTRNWPCWLL